jgi:hypothetical protein
MEKIVVPISRLSESYLLHTSSTLLWSLANFTPRPTFGRLHLVNFHLTRGSDYGDYAFRDSKPGLSVISAEFRLGLGGSLLASRLPVRWLTDSLRAKPDALPSRFSAW